MYQVKRLTGALVTTKGMYVANKALNKTDRPLYLLVQAPTAEQVERAADWIQKVRAIYLATPSVYNAKFSVSVFSAIYCGHTRS